ncbi:MAG: hypothetical protein LLG42_03615 [Chloroflexi bacterium]|nr:hypothetical protein [Chloroflexota bacterium]
MIEKKRSCLKSADSHSRYALSPLKNFQSNYSLGLFEPQNGSKNPRERDFHPLPVLGRGDGGLGDGGEIGNDLVLRKLYNTTIQIRGLVQHPQKFEVDF